MKKYCILWLTMRLMKKQKLRTLSLFCGIVGAGCLLYAFCGIGCYFWAQVHGGASEHTSYDFGQNVLIALAAVLLAVVFFCSAVWIRNLFSLALVRRQQSLRRILMLGASERDILFLSAAEIGILFCTAVPFGRILAFLAVGMAGVRLEMPFWMSSWIVLWLCGLSVCCGIIPIMRAVCRPMSQMHGPCPVNPALINRTVRKTRPALFSLRRHRHPAGNFAWYLSGRYHAADRKRHYRITLIMIAAMVLYVPAAYLIHTNIRINQEGLHEKYGIEYSCTPSDGHALRASIEECRNLAKSVAAESVFYVRIPGRAAIKSELLDGSLLAVLKKAGWRGGEQLWADSDIYFLEDTCYDAYIRSAFPEQSDTKAFLLDSAEQNTHRENAAGSGMSANPAGSRYAGVLVNSYINRTGFSKEADIVRTETSLLSKSAEKLVNQASGLIFSETNTASEDTGLMPVKENAFAEIKIYGGILTNEPDRQPYMIPAACTGELPEGIQAGNVTLIFPLGRMYEICQAIQINPDDRFADFFVCRLFADMDATLFDRIQRDLGSESQGFLMNKRENYRNWYNSLREIHRAMLSVCGILFLTALLQVFAALLFHCMQRGHGFAVLWSLGQTKRDLAVILVLESIRSFAHAVLAGMPLSCMLCCFLYRIYRNVWNTAFTLPFGQLFLITAMLALAAAAAVAVSFGYMDRQDFSKELRNIL